MIALTILSAGRDSRADHFTNVYFCLFLFFFLYFCTVFRRILCWCWRVAVACLQSRNLLSAT